jgi:hypothetical protein
MASSIAIGFIALAICAVGAIGMADAAEVRGISRIIPGQPAHVPPNCTGAQGLDTALAAIPCLKTAEGGPVQLSGHPNDRGTAFGRSTGYDPSGD